MWPGTEKDSQSFFTRPSSGGQGGSVQGVHSRCCGLDVHKDQVTACVLVFDDNGNRQVRKKE